MTAWMVGAAVFAAAVAVAAAWTVRRMRRDPPLGEAAAEAAAQAAVPGFAARRALIADDRRTALVVGEHGRVALVTAAGARPRVCEVRWNEIRAVDGGLRVEAQHGRSVFVPGVDVLDVRRTGDETWRRRPGKGSAN